jgi:hypothetical protein
MRNALLLFVALAVAGPAPVRAATPIDRPVTISRPGSYVVRSNLRSSGVPVIVIDSDNVVVDLGGHTLTTQDSVCCVIAVQTVTGVRIENGSLVGEGSGVGILATTSPELVLVNLALSEFETAIRLADSRAGTLRHLQVARGVSVGFDLFGSSGFIVEDNVIEATIGVRLDATSSSISRNFFGGELLQAPLVLGERATHGRIRDNVIRSNGPGIVVHGAGNHFEGTVINSAGCSLWFKPESRHNLLRSNTSRGDADCACPGTARGSVCDEGLDNLSHGDNYLPGPS